jgi:hypothetical protein
VQVYVKAPGYENTCEKRQLLSNVTLWITLIEPQTWLFSTPKKQKLTIQCNDQAEQKLEIERTGKLSINENCKLTTPDIIIKTKRQTNMKPIQMHLADFNLTLTTENRPNKEQAKKEIRLEPVIRNPSELMELSLDLNEINKELDQPQESLIKNPYVIYPVGSTLTILLIVSVIGISICITKRIKKRKSDRPQLQNDSAILY